MMESKQLPNDCDYSQEYLENLLQNINALGTTVRGRAAQQNIAAMLKECLVSSRKPAEELPTGQIDSIVTKTGGSEWVMPDSQLWEACYAKAVLAHFYNGMFYLSMNDLHTAEAADREIYNRLTSVQAVSMLSNLEKRRYHAFAHVCREVLQYLAGEDEGRFCIYSMNRDEAKHLTDDERAYLLPDSPFWREPILGEVAEHIVAYRNGIHNSHTYYRLYESLNEAHAEKALQTHDRNLEEIKKLIRETEIAIDDQMHRLQELQDEYKRACMDLMPDIEFKIDRLHAERLELESQLSTVE